MAGKITKFQVHSRLKKGTILRDKTKSEIQNKTFGKGFILDKIRFEHVIKNQPGNQQIFKFDFFFKPSIM